MPESPLPPRNGLAATRVRLPASTQWPTALAYLAGRFPEAEVRLRELFAAGEVVDADGEPLEPTTPYRPGTSLYLYRDPPDEVPVPFSIEILHRDDDIVVVDKPHFLSTMPRGRHVLETALVRLRRDLDLPDLSPAHRLDRMTAGVLLFTARPSVRRAYHELFAERAAEKVYEAVAPFDPGLRLPRTVRSRIVKRRGVLRAEVIDGEPNAETYVELLDVRADRGLYRLRPRTGRTHQLRAQMDALGVPIAGDNYYPQIRDVADGDFTTPLQLVARSLEFIDPFTGAVRRFRSNRRLSARDS
ncbi:MAG: pseudouridine synthase [Actinomycetia bacterium]|nr:pseudouridine synthase [Actinomycetes bacterium]